MVPQKRVQDTIQNHPGHKRAHNYKGRTKAFPPRARCLRKRGRRGMLVLAFGQPGALPVCDRFRQLIKMFVERFCHRIEPVRGADVEFQISGWLNFLHSKWNDDGVRAGGAFHFAHYLAGFVRLAGEDQDKDRAFVDRIQDSGAIIFSRCDIARRDPTRNAVGFEKTADLVADRFVF